MRAKLAASMADTEFGLRASEIVRSCVHCGFCNATCPTYQLTGNELEGPRGRVYLIKSLLEEGEAGLEARAHLDHCLVCRNCETTCPSGVRYGELIELARPRVYATTPSGWREALTRRALKSVVPHRRRFGALLGLGRFFRPLMPQALARLVPPRPQLRVPPARALADDAPRVLILEGCAQPALNPAIDAAAASVFAALGMHVVRAGGGCCGALGHHLGDEAMGLEQARANIDAWWGEVERGAHAIIATASGCTVQLKSYARLLADDPQYAERAARIEALVRDPLELVDSEQLRGVLDSVNGERVAVQAPCSLQHGQKLIGRLEELFVDLGFELSPVAESHLCCGSAGAYSILHPDNAQALRTRKLDHLMRGKPGSIVTANIGCQTHLAATAEVPVRHWLEVLASKLRD